MKKICFRGVLLLLFANIALAQPSPLQGDWLGSLSIQSMSLRIVFHVSHDNDTTWTATMDSPDQGATGIPLERIEVTDRTIRMGSSRLRAEYSGSIQPGDSTIEGTWSQGGATFPLSVKRLLTEVTVNRPQEPKPPYPYTAEEVTFTNQTDGIVLAGTLTLPRGEGPFPAVALVTGSGPQDRDETVFNHRPFKVLADHLTRNGIAVLRYDDRGVGQSKGSFAGATSIEFSRDAESAVMYLSTRPEVAPSKIGLIGHSEGGLIAPIVAARSTSVAFIVMLAGPSITGAEIILMQDSLISAANGRSADQIRESMATNHRIFDLIASEEDTASLRQQLRAMLLEVASNQSGASSTEEARQAAVEQNVSQLLSPWFLFFLRHDPAPVLESVTCPVLALNGENDLQVPSRINLDGITTALRKGGNMQVTVREMKGLNHLFQTSSTGSPTEYAMIEETFSPLALSVITEWITSVTSKDGR